MVERLARRTGALLLVVMLAAGASLLLEGTSFATDPASSSDPSPTQPATSDPTAPDPTTTGPATDPSSPAGTSDPAPASDPAPGPPAVTHDQETTVAGTGTAVANTGADSATGIVTAPPDGGSEGSAHVSAGVASGSASATGAATADGVTQLATASATAAGQVLITQIALVVNIGLAIAASGGDVAATGISGSPGAAGVALVRSGDAAAVGLDASTAVTQVVNLLDADEETHQVATVMNVGSSVANTGANVSTGVVSRVGPDGTAIALSWGPAPATADVTTGPATAVGDMSRTTIIQVAVGTAADDGSLQIVQRAVVVNFGAGLANSGSNAAGVSDPQVLFVQGLVLALLAMLSPSASGTTATVPVGSGGVATVSTGTAVAVGNQSDTTIRQAAQGSVSGDHVASAEQSAVVGNFGVGVANSGANVAVGSGSAAAGPDTTLSLTDGDFAAVTSLFAQFMGLLVAPSDQAQWTGGLQLGRELLAASASIAAVEAALKIPSSDGATAQVMVRQITAVLNLSLALATSGDNTASTSGGGTVVAGSRRNERARAGDPAASVAGIAVVRTGDATAVNHTQVVVCQLVDAPASECPQPDTPVPPVSPPAVAPAVAVASPPAAGAAAASPGGLAFTGAAGTPTFVVAGLFALVLGLLLLLVSLAVRRRRA